jgi:hypothetical protein
MLPSSQAGITESSDVDPAGDLIIEGHRADGSCDRQDAAL